MFSLTSDEGIKDDANWEQKGGRNDVHAGPSHILATAVCSIKGSVIYQLTRL